MRHDTLDSLMKRVITEHERQVDILADTRHMSVVVESSEEGHPVTLSVDTDGDTLHYAPSDHMLGQISTDTGIPKRYFDRMRESAPELFAKNVHHWLYEEPKRRMLRAYKTRIGIGGALVGSYDPVLEGRAWLSDRYRRLDNIEIARKLLPEFERLPQEVEFHNASTTPEKFFLRATFPQMLSDVKVGQTVSWGVQIRNSEVGAGTFAIENFLLVLACKNGMVVTKVQNTRHVGMRIDDILSDEAKRADDKAFWLAARDTLRASIDEAAFEAVVSQLRETTEGTPIVRPLKATERLAKAVGLTEEEQELVLGNLIRDRDMSQWGALNAVTYASHQVKNFDRGVELEEIGWKIANMPAREWDRIAVAA